jgi:hypothetical protein
MILTVFLAVVGAETLEFQELTDLKTVTEGFKENKVTFLVLKNVEDESFAKLFGDLQDNLVWNYKESLPFLNLAISSCEKLPDFCEAEQLDPYKNYVHVLRQSSFKHAELVRKTNLVPLLFRVADVKSRKDLNRVNLMDRRRVTVVFNFPNNSTVREHIDRVIGAVSIKAFGPVDFALITGNEMDMFDLNDPKNVGKILMAVDEKLLEIPHHDFNPKSVGEAINWELNADVEHLAVDTYYRIFMSPMINKIFLIKRTADACPDLTQAFEEAAVQNRHHDLYMNRVLFVVADIDRVERSKYPSLNQILWQMAGEEFLKSRECTVLLSGMRLEENIKYLNEDSDNSKDGILGLIERYHALKLDERFYKSELPGATTVGDTSIFRVIGSTFRQSVIQRDSHDFLLVCRESNVECDTFVEFLDLIAQKVEAFDVRFAVLDAKRNEVPALRLGSLPAFLFYRNGKKSRPETLSKKFDYGTVLEFINQWLNRIEKPLVQLTREDKAQLLNKLGDKYPAEFAAIKQAFEQGSDFLDEAEEPIEAPVNTDL